MFLASLADSFSGPPCLGVPTKAREGFIMFTVISPSANDKNEFGKNKFDKVTIYRTLESLANAKLVHKAFVEDRARYFELAHNCTETQCHPHFTCTNCSDTLCLTEISLPKMKDKLSGYLVKNQTIQFEGLCPK